MRRGSGFVVDALHSARIAGGIAGIRDGVGAIPERWLQALRGREKADPLLAALRAVPNVPG